MNEPPTTSSTSSIADPPGGIFIWIIVTLELLTFGIALIAFAASAKSHPEIFHASSQLLDLRFGLANTIFLITSGYFMAECVRHFHSDQIQKSRRALTFALGGGMLFLISKSLEYADKISHGHTLGSDPFFTWYWLLTAFHLMHVVVGMIILAFLLRRLGEAKSENIEAGGAFWHMCDLVWLFLFPAIYLVF